MGNSPLASRQHRNGDQFYQVQLGESADLYFRRIEVKRQGNGKITEAWLISYQVDMSTCNFALTKTKVNSNSHDPHHDDGMLDIKILDDAHGISRDCFSVTVQRAKAGRLLHPTFSTGLNMNPRNSAAAIVSSHTTITTNSRGGITETSFDIYGSGTRRGLTVREWEKNSKDEKPYMGTVAHYYAYKGNGKDVGLSVVAKRIRVSEDGHLDFDVDGPQQHPVRALFFMFDEVLRTGTWKPTYCPHCANDYIFQRHRTFWLSETEDSDEDYHPAALLLGRRQNAGRIIANDGYVDYGNYNNKEGHKPSSNPYRNDNHDRLRPAENYSAMEPNRNILGGLTKPKVSTAWTAPPRKGTQLSKPTSNIDEAMELLKEAAKVTPNDHINKGGHKPSNNWAVNDSQPRSKMQGHFNGSMLNLSNNFLAALPPGRNKNAGGIIANGGVIRGNNNGNLPISKGSIANDGVIKGNININGNLFVDKLIIVHEVNVASTKYGKNSTDGLSNKILEWWAYATSFINIC